jgi:hypothetical protein
MPSTIEAGKRKEEVYRLAHYLILFRYDWMWRAKRKAILDALRAFGAFDELEIRDAVYLADLYL